MSGPGVISGNRPFKKPIAEGGHGSGSTSGGEGDGAAAVVAVTAAAVVTSGKQWVLSTH